MFQRLATLDFITRQENLIITGPSGLCKSYISQALEHQACRMGYKVLYQNTGRRLKKLKLAKVDGTYLKGVKKINLVNLLIHCAILRVAPYHRNHWQGWTEITKRINYMCKSNWRIFLPIE